MDIYFRKPTAQEMEDKGVKVALVIPPLYLAILIAGSILLFNHETVITALTN